MRLAVAAVLLAAGLQPVAGAPRPAAAPRQAGIATLEAALARAFATNPDILAQRAQVRATQETIPQARAGLLPQVSATAYAGVLATRSILRGSPVNVPDGSTLPQRGIALTATQALFDGWRTQNSVLQAQRLTIAQREQLRAIEQAVLLDVATTFIAAHTGQALVEVQRRNVEFLTTTLTTTRTRLASGIATPTDVSQAEARLSRGAADLNSAEANLAIARDRFLRIVGAPASARLASLRTIDAVLPRTREAARDVAARDNPAVLAAGETLRGAEAAVRVAQGQMLPQVSIQGQVGRDYDVDSSTRRTDSAQLVGRVTVPLYSGGAPEAQVRQSRELVGQAQMQLDSARLQARSAAYSGHVALETARFASRAAIDEVRAAEVTVDGMRRQMDAGLRTLTELLNAQQDLIAARARLIVASGDRMVAAYTILAATGKLELPRLGIREPAVASRAPQSDLGVRFDAWGELRNPTGAARPPTIANR